MSEDDDICVLSDLPTEQCAHCQGIIPEPTEMPGAPLKALFQSTCPDCGDDIYPGDWIRFTDHGWTHWRVCSI